MNKAVDRGKRSLSTEKLPLCLDSRLDLCYHVYLDGNLVVRSLECYEIQRSIITETTTAPAPSPSSTAAEP
jgi:hypothetical protein